MCVRAWRSANVVEQEKCGQQRDTKYRSSQIDVVPNAPGLSPPERRKNREGFENVSKGHDYEAGGPRSGKAEPIVPRLR
jgi:hypothetical protein